MAQAQLKVFFDLDGTLLDVSERNYRVYSELVAEFGGTPMPKDVYWDLKRKKTKWPVLLPKSQLSPNLEDAFLESFIPRIEAIEYLRLDVLFPDSLSVVAALAARYSCDLVSLRRNAANLEEELAWLNLRPHFTKVLSGHSESDGYDKKIELIRNELGGGKGVIIGDTEADIVTGKELGLTTIAVTSGIRDEHFLRALEPDYIVKHISEVLALPVFR